MISHVTAQVMRLRPVSLGETVSPETSFRIRETSSARLPLSPGTLANLVGKSKRI